MPLEKAAEGTPGFKRNIEREMNAGKPQKQAVAIAYSKARGDVIAPHVNGPLAEVLDAFTKRLDACAKRLDDMERSCAQETLK